MPYRSRGARLLDALVRRLAAPLAGPAAQALARVGVGPRGLAWASIALGLAAALAASLARDGLAALLLVPARLVLGLADTLPRAARGISRPADLATGCAIPLAFALRDPANASAAAVLVGALALGAVASSRTSGAPAVLGAGLSGRTGSTLFSLAMLAWPGAFPVLALALAGLTLMAALTRLAAAGTIARAEADEER